MMQSLWKLCLFLSCTAVLLVSVEAGRISKACYGEDANLDCFLHDLRCQYGSIFITHAFRGFKPAPHWCHVPRPNCWDVYTCCQYHSGDCLEYYTQAEFSSLMGKCWNEHFCSYKVPNANRIKCDSNYKNASGYSLIDYLCLSDSAIINFQEGEGTRAGSLALRYTRSSDTGSHICLVESVDCSNCSVNLLLYRTSTDSSLGNCTSVGVSYSHWLPCNAGWAQHSMYQFSRTFSVWLDVNKNNDADEAWAFIYGNTGSQLRVTCEPWNYKDSFPQSPSGTTPRTTSEITTLPREGQTTGSSAIPGTTSAAGVQSSTTSSPAKVSSREVSGDTLALSSESSSSTAGIVGGVVGGLLLLAVVVAVVVAVVFLKRRDTTTKPFSKVVAWFRGGNSSRSDGNSGRAEPHGAHAQPTSLPVYDNSMVTITDEAGVRDPDSDYNHLGQKPTSSASRDVTYGHLADGNDVTDYGYDHVAKGKPAARSGDVINNVYDTAGPATGGSIDEDFYHTTSSAKNRPDIINNVYNTADVPGHDVTNIVYDTPKSSRTAGHDETEAHDVTGHDAGSPYELARSVT